MDHDDSPQHEVHDPMAELAGFADEHGATVEIVRDNRGEWAVYMTWVDPICGRALGLGNTHTEALTMALRFAQQNAAARPRVDALADRHGIDRGQAREIARDLLARQ